MVARGVAGWALAVAVAVAGLCGVADAMADTAAIPAGAAAVADAPIALIPQPVVLERKAGQFIWRDGAVVDVADGDDGALHAAQRLVALARASRGLRLVLHRTAAAPSAHEETPGRPKFPHSPSGGLTRSGRFGGALKAAIVLRRDAAVAGGPEAYALDVGPSGIRIAASGDAGLDFAVTTLWQMLTSMPGQGAAQLPCVHIDDRPRYAWRGLMLDVARHYTAPADIERLLDQMALLKLNVFHWHLTDDQGWRLAIERYPALTAVGAWRTPPGGQPPRYGGYYTQAQVRHLVAYAAERHITVVPEIEMPGHAQAAVAAYPQFGLGAPGTPHRPPVGVDWGVNPYLYNVDEATFTFIERVLDEVMALFPSTYIHVGGDEAVKDAWAASPVAQARIRALGLAAPATGAAASAPPAATATAPAAATHSPEDRLQSWFIARIGTYLAAHGRRLIGWDEILEGGLPAGASVMSWRGTEGAVAAARQGHDVVMAPAGWLYLDNLQSPRGDEPAGRVAQLPIERVYAFNPEPQGLDAAQAAHVLGLEAALWTEYMTSPWHVAHALYPRLAAAAELAWSPAATHDWAGFVPRLAVQLRRYRDQGIAAADSAFAVDATLDHGDAAAALEAGVADVRLSTQVAHGTIRYTLDGSPPDARSTPYGGPFPVRLPATVRAAAYADDGTALSAARTTVFDAATLHHVDSSRLVGCPGHDLGLRVPLTPDATTTRPVHNVDLFDACWIWPQAPLDGVAGITIDAARLARNYGLAHDAAKVVRHPARTQAGEIEVHRDGCDGPLLATLPVPAGERIEPLRLQATMAPQAGAHDLCLRSTAPVVGPYIAVDAVQLGGAH